MNGDNPPGKVPGNSWTYNCRPIVEAGQALLVEDTFQLDDTFTLTPTPGHSPGHCCVKVPIARRGSPTNRGARATVRRPGSPISRPRAAVLRSSK